MIQANVMNTLVVKTELQRLLGVTYQDVDVGLCTMPPMYAHNTYFYDRRLAILAMKRFYETQIGYFRHMNESSGGKKYYIGRVKAYSERLGRVMELMREWGIEDGSPDDH